MSERPPYLRVVTEDWQSERPRTVAPIETSDDDTDTPAMSDRETDAKIAAAEARTDTKFAQVLGEVRTTHAQLLGEIKATRAEFAGAIKATDQKLDHLSETVSIARAEATSNRNIILGILVPTLIGGFVAMFFGLFATLQWSDARMFGVIQLREMMRLPAATATEPVPAKPAAATVAPTLVPGQTPPTAPKP